MIKRKNILAVTLTRKGSRSIPLKCIAMCNGKPLLEYTVIEALKSKYIDDYYVATDSDDIQNVADKLKVPIIRLPESVTEDNSKSSEALLSVVNELECRGLFFDYIVELMVTNPLKVACDIDGCIEKLHKTRTGSVVSVVRLMDHHPSRIKYIDDDILMDFFPETLESKRESLLPHAYIRNGSIYAMTHDFLIENRSRYNKKTRPYIVPEERSVNVDGPIDLLLAECMLKKRNDCL